MLNKTEAKKGRLSLMPLLSEVEVIIIITNMVLCPDGLSDEVDLWELHSETFNPAISLWRGLTLTPAAGGTYS